MIVLKATIQEAMRTRPPKATSDQPRGSFHSRPMKKGEGLLTEDVCKFRYR